jgi:hypothetical protein
LASLLAFSRFGFIGSRPAANGTMKRDVLAHFVVRELRVHLDDLAQRHLQRCARLVLDVHRRARRPCSA